MVCLEIGYPKIHSFIIVPIMMAGLIPTISFWPDWFQLIQRTLPVTIDGIDFLLKFPTNIAIYSDSQKTKKSWKPGAYGETSSNFHILGHTVFLGPVAIVEALNTSQLPHPLSRWNLETPWPNLRPSCRASKRSWRRQRFQGAHGPTSCHGGRLSQSFCVISIVWNDKPCKLKAFRSDRDGG